MPRIVETSDALIFILAVRQKLVYSKTNSKTCVLYEFDGVVLGVVWTVYIMERSEKVVHGVIPNPKGPF
jgi:hypothetical protein